MSERLVTLGMIIAAVEAATGLTRREIISERRSAEFSRARFAVWWLASKLTLHSLPELGRETNRDHSCVHAGLRRAEELRASNRDSFRQATDALLLTLQALERAGNLRLAGAADPIAAARRVVSRPEREAVRVSTAEIIAMSQALLALHDAAETDLSPSQEAAHEQA